MKTNTFNWITLNECKNVVSIMKTVPEKSQLLNLSTTSTHFLLAAKFEGEFCCITTESLIMPRSPPKLYY